MVRVLRTNPELIGLPVINKRESLDCHWLTENPCDVIAGHAGVQWETEGGKNARPCAFGKLRKINLQSTSLRRHVIQASEPSEPNAVAIPETAHPLSVRRDGLDNGRRTERLQS